MNSAYRRISLFFLVAYAFTWFGHLGNWLVPSDAWPVPMFPLGPFIAALFVLWFTRGVAGLKDWLRRVVRFRAPLWVYAVLFFVPLAIILASVGLAIALGTPHGPLPAYSPIEYLLFIPIVLLAGPAPEETAFRGLGQHQLQETISPLAASLWIGLGVLIWHLPLFFSGEIPWPIAVTLIAVSVVYAWLYVAGGSVWPLVTLHFVQNYFGGGYFGRLFSENDAAIWVGILTVFYIVWALFLVWNLGPSLGKRRPLAG